MRQRRGRPHEFRMFFGRATWTRLCSTLAGIAGKRVYGPMTPTPRDLIDAAVNTECERLENEHNHGSRFPIVRRVRLRGRPRRVG